MTSEQISIILGHAGVPINKWTTISTIYQLNLDSDGNEVICDYKIYYFDTELGILKVKQGYRDENNELKPSTDLDVDYVIAFEHINGATFGTPYSDKKENR